MESWATSRSKSFPLTVLVLTGFLLLSEACGGDDEAPSRLAPPATKAATDGVKPGNEVHSPRPKASREKLFSVADRTNFARLTRELGGRSGVTVSGVGRKQRIERLGTLEGGMAWSSIKVPIGLAVVEQGGVRSKRDLLRRAITASDNNAAEQLWASLGPPRAAGRAVEGVLKAAGDTTTRVQTKRIRVGFTSFGQTEWPLTSQQRFVAGLPCLAASDRILELMGHVIASQRWGLGMTGLQPRFKGGWGPDRSGRYLVRQMGLLKLPNGTFVAATVAAIASDGRFDSGTRNLTAIARWLTKHVNRAAVPARKCRPRSEDS
jgi:hypothetical protein